MDDGMDSDRFFPYTPLRLCPGACRFFLWRFLPPKSSSCLRILRILRISNTKSSPHVYFSHSISFFSSFGLFNEVWESDGDGRRRFEGIGG